jgi:hypothetical protein
MRQKTAGGAGVVETEAKEYAGRLQSDAERPGQRSHGLVI